MGTLWSRRTAIPIVVSRRGEGGRMSGLDGCLLAWQSAHVAPVRLGSQAPRA